MSTILSVQENEAEGKAKEVFEDIKKTFGLPFVPALFRSMALNPDYLEATWTRFKIIMGPGELTRREKEIIALAVSATNNCEYCVLAHTAMLKQLGLSEKGVLEVMSVVEQFNGFNAFIDGLRIKPDLK